MSDLVSAVITTFRRPKDIVLRAVNSVIAQTYKNIEIIVVDDSGKDYENLSEVKNAVLKLNEITDKKITYITNEVSLGACGARNVGLDLCKGDFIGFLDDDDEWASDKTEKLLPLLKDERVALAYSDCLNVFDDSGEKRVSDDKAEKRSGNIYGSLILHNYIGSTSNPIIRTEYLKEIGGFDVLMRAAQDCDVWLRLAAKYMVEYLGEPLTVYHVHCGERISTDPEKRLKGLLRLNEKNAEYIKTHRKARWIRNLVLVPFYVATGDKKTAWSVWLKCLILQPFALKTNFKYFYYYLIKKNRLNY